MEIKKEIKLLKKLDEHECVLYCSESAPLDFLMVCIEHFKTFIDKQIEDSKKAKAEVTEV